MKIFAIVGLALAVNSMLVNGLALKGSNAPRLSAQTQQQEALTDLQDEQPMPYQFNYETQSEGGSSSRSESGDGSGKVLGSYSIKGADGISRTVSYTADSDGFRANISTNEPGTESQNPSFIVLQSSQLPAAEITRQLQVEIDANNAQQEEQSVEEAPEAPVKAAPVSAPPRKLQSSAPQKSTRRPAAAPQKSVSVPVKSRRPQQQAQLPQQPQPVSAPPAKRASAPVKSSAVRSRAPAKSSFQQPAVQRPRQVAAQPAKRPVQAVQPVQLPQEEESLAEAPAQLSQSPDETAEDDSQDF